MLEPGKGLGAIGATLLEHAEVQVVEAVECGDEPVVDMLE